MNGLLYVALGGALGASGRHLLGMMMLKMFGPDYPYGTMAANIIGGFLMGLLAGWLALKVSGGENLRLFLGVGLLGGFTTFSAFSLDAVLMYEKKAYGALMSYIGGSVVLSIGALMIGLILARKIFGYSGGIM
jgi:CrcB protein